MPLQKAQLHRLTRIAAMLKENRYPNSESLVREFRRIAVEEELEIDCSRKTILRDMKTLEFEFQCPLAFDRARNGYYLKRHDWDFIAPALLDENEMLASVIGARISEDIFPSPLKNRIRNAVDYLLQNHNPDFLDTANLASLTILSGLYIQLDREIFMKIFETWQTHRTVKIAYADYRGHLTERVFEPHTLVFYNNSWYSKGFCRLKKQPRTFALHRIRSAEPLPEHFTPDEKIIRSVTVDDFLGFEKVRNVKLKITEMLRDVLAVRPLHSRQSFLPDGTVEIPAVSREILFPFLLAQQGLAELLEPAGLRQEFQEMLRTMLAVYETAPISSPETR